MAIVDLATKQSASYIRPTSWADGLRGIAALFVVASHTCLSFATYLIPPSFAETGKSILFQRPLFRLVIQGQAWVAIFLVLLGFVNALKPLQLARRGATADALAALSTGAFRRKWRLVFPAALMTILAWLLCQFGVFQLGRRVDAYWLRATSPQRSPSLGAAVVDLIRQIAGTWMYGENAYDHTSMGTATPFPWFTICIHDPASFDGTVGTNIFAGMILAELSFYNLTALRPRLIFKILPYGLVTLGLYICSYPDQYADQTAWSSQLASLAETFFPKDANVSRYYASLGAQMICLGVMLSPSLRRMLSHPMLLWFGSISFPLYLVHGPLMRSVLVYLLYLPMAIGFEPVLRADGTPDPESYISTPSPFRLGVILVMFFAFLLYVVQQWAKHIEPKMGALTAALERFSRSWGKNAVWTSKEKDEMLPVASVRELSR
ncbi:uncharacterized protein N7525_002644 [Penicillium rubens]|uniref:uncharacterized protein n=1 Tax=Penicillium rubens TaxID=1108849 RepID=UPI002A59ADA6|nr:uncharacterized protein N7525_002644 [Penicillium rubens]KAJ5837456.1 hypothetical protein N7525_002644 [Penicillium rubens]